MLAIVEWTTDGTSGLLAYLANNLQLQNSSYDRQIICCTDNLAIVTKIGHVTLDFLAYVLE
ncbi:hypothetical protein [Loigolactobacillus backii]|uniref:hypothetical protein n=1 Tax=Loigolactobacillus backii TaxID=375175 RepID=UPI0022FD8CCA|nr:hypothetical protein [Loigolactobacillus backii]